MSNPWSRAVATTWPNGPNQSPDNMSSLANGQARGLGIINPSTLSQPFGDIILPPWKISTGTVSAGNTISRYLLFSEDNTLWPGGISPTSTFDQSAALNNWLAYDPAAAALALIDTLNMQAGVSLYQNSMAVYPWPDRQRSDLLRGAALQQFRCGACRLFERQSERHLRD